MLAGSVCKQCGASNLIPDHETGEIICGNCGAVAEESRIVSEVSFSETSGGKAVVTGQYISHDQTGVLGNSLYGMQSGESRQQTVEKAKRRLEKIGMTLHIPEHVVEASLRYFRTALANNFVKGRKSQHVLCACLYLACRQNKTDHMLMDFAEAIGVNVFHIGATYLQLVRNQKIKELPIVDPTVYIQRFTSKLQFGNDMGRRVVNDAKLLVQRMGKDWLQQGRRPAGVAAACILLAARMNNFRRSKAEIVQVAKIAEETLQRRLDEFRNTSAGTLTVQDFRNTNIESAADPPSFTRHRELERQLAQQMAQRQEALDEGYKPEGTIPDRDDPYLDPDMVRIAKELDVTDGTELKFQADVNEILENPELMQQAAEMSEQSPTERDEVQNMQRARRRRQSQSEAVASQHPPSKRRRGNSQSVNEEDPDVTPETRAYDEDASSDENSSAALEGVGEDRAVSDAIASSISSNVRLGRAERFLYEFRQRREERLAAEQERAQQEALRKEQEIAEDPEALSDVDDDEIESILLNEDEIELKAKVWMSINKDYLLEQERKRLRQEADAINGVVKPQRKARKTRVKPEIGQPTTAGANAANMLKEKIHSKKINYAAMKELFSK